MYTRCHYVLGTAGKRGHGTGGDCFPVENVVAETEEGDYR